MAIKHDETRLIFEWEISQLSLRGYGAVEHWSAVSPRGKIDELCVWGLQVESIRVYYQRPVNSLELGLFIGDWFSLEPDPSTRQDEGEYLSRTGSHLIKRFGGAERGITGHGRLRTNRGVRGH